ncbi:MAG: phosphatase PAP2 family protein [Candidatus Eisenbacteria bacterium]|nr:phosphatase PAP2 family protein [Candidatus Eisenbacteria bacterium]
MIAKLLQYDAALFLWLREATRSGWGDDFFPWITELDNFWIPLALLWLFLLIFQGARGRRTAWLIVIAVILADQISSGMLKEWVERVRPCHALEGVTPHMPQARSPSFPSGHATNSFAVTVIMGLGLGRAWWSGLAVAAAISFSRIYVGVHYPLDVLAGALLGTGLALLIHEAIPPGFAWSLARLLRVRRRKSAPPGNSQVPNEMDRYREAGIERETYVTGTGKERPDSGAARDAPGAAPLRGRRGRGVGGGDLRLRAGLE